MKGIILAGGSGTRLYPLTKSVSKQLLPVYDKPMIYYAVSVLMLAGIRDILIISTPRDLPLFKQLFSNGRELGLNMSYLVQPKPAGLAHAFLLSKDYIKNEEVALVLGDNLFFGDRLQNKLREAVERTKQGKTTIFGYRVLDPTRYGIVEIDRFGKAISIEEKPSLPRSNICVTGLYMYDHRVVSFAERVKPSARGELEITDINKLYLEESSLHVSILEDDCTWFDMGTIDSLLEASTFVQQWQDAHNAILLAPEEIAYNNGWINQSQLAEVALFYKNTSYQSYLNKLL